jgi:hypothetical protein
VCLTGAVVALGAAALRKGLPDPAQGAVVLLALVATTSQVVARCAQWSVDRPYAAALREARDQPAPPAAMAAYSARLAVSTTATGLIYYALVLGAQRSAADTGAVAFAALVTIVFVAVAARRVAAVSRRWSDHSARMRILATVAGAQA